MMSFILTKWYVNLLEGDTIEEKDNGFILTKWYVNAYYYQKKECIFKCFILTKWYVNTLINYLRLYEALVLY